MANEIELFSDNGKDIAIPSEQVIDKGNALVEELASPDVKQAILGEKVKTLLIPENVEIELPNYVIDFREIEKVADFQLAALASILRDSGETNIYVIVKNGMELIGKGNTDDLNDILALGIYKIFGDKCKIYRDVERDKAVKRVIMGDPTNLRLNI